MHKMKLIFTTLVILFGSHVLRASEFLEQLNVTGAIEIESYFHDRESSNFERDQRSDIEVAAIDLLMSSKFNEKIEGFVYWTYSDGGDSFASPEEAYLVYHSNYFDLKAGKTYLPFGHFSSDLILDTLTTDLAETNANAVVLSKAWTNLDAHLFVFNGSIDVAQSDKASHLSDYGASVDIKVDDHFISFGYISNLSSSSGMTSQLENLDGIKKEVPGAIASFIGKWGRVTFRTEYVHTLKEYEVAELAQGGIGARPRVWSHELALQYDHIIYALSYQGTSDLMSADFPQSRLGLGVSYQLMSASWLRFEFNRDQDYSVSSGATGKSLHRSTIQWAYEF